MRTWLVLIAVSSMLFACGEEEEVDIESPAPVAPIAPQVAPMPDTPAVAPVAPVAPEPVGAGQPAPTGGPTPPTTATATPTPTPTESGSNSNSGNSGSSNDSNSNATGMAAAQRCLLRGDQACAQRALRGHTRNANEEAALIQATRALGQNQEATRLMRQFVQQHPNSPQTPVFQRALENGSNGSNGSPVPSGLPNPGSLLGM